MSELGPEVLKIDEFSGREEPLELDPARLAPGSRPGATRAQPVHRCDRSVLRRHLAQQSGRVARLLYRERVVPADRRPGPHQRRLRAHVDLRSRRLLRDARGLSRPVGSARAGAQVLRHLRACRRRLIRRPLDTPAWSIAVRGAALLRRRSAFFRRNRSFCRPRGWHVSCNAFCQAIHPEPGSGCVCLSSDICHPQPICRSFFCNIGVDHEIESWPGCDCSHDVGGGRSR